MRSTFKIGIALALIPQLFLVKWASQHPDSIEKYYSTGIYPVLSQFFRGLFGWLPFSVGDILYFVLIVLALRYIILHRRAIRAKPMTFLLHCAMIISVAYFTFYIMWGLNYFRKPIADQLQLPKSHTKEQLISFIERLTVKANESHYKITADSATAVRIPYSKKEIFKKTIDGYGVLGKQIPFLEYQRPSIKKSIFSLPLTYMGYGGYLNPFTNEGQVNATMPVYRFPVVAGHEIGHQLGYSAENETNFIGYLVTVTNEDAYFKYAGYTYALAYCLGELQSVDEAQFNQHYSKLNEGILMNYKEMNDFWLSYENPLEPVFKSTFNAFLKANNQVEGIMSYNSVVSLLVNYYEQHEL
ncbi:MAG: DUF3810 domain-containing protein [Flavobacteriaceae bacterium]